MAATAVDINPVRFGRMHGDSPHALGVKAGEVIPQGALVARDATGFMVNAIVATTLKCIGVARRRYDATGLASGALVGEADAGDYLFANSSAGDAITDADVGNDSFAVDNTTVAKTNGSTTRSIAGRIVKVNPTGYTGVVVRVGV